MNRLIASVVLVLALTGCSSSEVDLTPAQGLEGRCVQERTKTVLGVFKKTTEQIVNC